MTTHSYNWRWLAMTLIWCVIGGLAYGGSLGPPERSRTSREYDALLRANKLWQCMAQNPRLNGGQPHYCIDYPVISEPMIILVRVVGTVRETTLLVLKSWRGPFSAGRVLHAHPVPIIEPQYFFQTGDKDKELLILADPGVSSSDADAGLNRIVNPPPSGVWPAAEAQPLMEALDEAVRGDQALRIDLALKKCLADASKHPKAEFLNVRCQAQARLDELLLSHTEYAPEVIAARAKLEELKRQAVP